MESDTKKLTDTTKLLRECDAGTKMAISSINEILEKVEDTKLNEILTKSGNQYLNQYAMADVISKKITEKLIRLEENLRKELSTYL